MSQDRPIPWLRLLAILAVGTYLQIGPTLSQGFGLERHTGFKTWRMYRNFGRDICRVRYHQHLPDGEIVEKSRFEVLDYTYDEAPSYVQFIPSVAQVARTGRTMCHNLGNDVDLRVTGECGSIQEWRPLDVLADVDLCGLTQSELLALDPKNNKKAKSKAKAPRDGKKP